MSIYLNQRSCNRNRYESPLQFSRKSGDDCFSAQMQDCSKNGVGFLSDYPYLPETHINVKTNKEARSFPAKVKWSRPEFDIDSGALSYRVGAEFVEQV